MYSKRILKKKFIFLKFLIFVLINPLSLLYQTKKLKLKNMTQITTNSILKATSICDSNCIWIANVIERKGNFITAKIGNEIMRKKVKVWNDEEYVMLLGNYSMAPMFKLA
jgi:hypothetical protein